MIIQYLKQHQDFLLEEKTACEADYEKAEQQIKTIAEFQKILEQKIDPDYEAFTPHVVHPRDKEKISELKVEEEELRKRKEELKKRITELEEKLDEVKDVIAEAMDSEKRYAKLEEEQEKRQSIQSKADQEMLLTRLELCEKIALVDPHRCREELRSLLEKVKEWDDESIEE